LERIVWLTKANNDLIDIYNYISKDSIYYAMKTVNEIINKVEILHIFPYSGRILNDIVNEEYRELIYKSYRIIYKIKISTIYIHRVWHSAREISNIFLK
jgi:similar to Q10Z72_TRIEI GUN4-like